MFLSRPCADSSLRPNSTQHGARNGLVCRPTSNWLRLTAAWLFCCAIVALPTREASASKYVSLDYNLTLNSRSRDTVFLELFDDRPLTQANFLQYVNNTVANGKFDGTIMHRLARNFVIQGGGYYPVFVQEPAPVNVSLDPTATVDLDGISGTSNPTVAGEAGNSPTRSNITGTVSMALSTGPNSGTNQWFVNLANNTFLDNAGSGGPFTVFAKVAGDGMSLFNAFNGLLITNLNPDTNNDGARDGGPFFNYNAPLDNNGQPTDGVPYLSGQSADILVVLERAKQIDYLGSGLTTNVPAGGLTFATRDAYIDTGTLFTGTGAIAIGAGRALGIREGFSLGNTLINHGKLDPGLQLGSITVPDYFQYSDGALDIQLRGTTADTEYDQLLVTNSANLAGKLSVSLLSGFAPVGGNSFTVLTANSIFGNFNSYELPQLTAGLVWSISNTGTAITLTVVSADYNKNGVVDAADYGLWRKTAGAPANYTTWRSNFANTAGGSSGGGAGGLAASAVPEPASCVISLFAGLLLGFTRRRRSTIVFRTVSFNYDLSSGSWTVL
jgi:cyclophilin family peptidyl-prolyl cis-trans isomerase